MPRQSQPKRSSPRQPLGRLTPAGRTILAHIINGIALGDFKRLRSVESLAASLDRTPAGLQRMIRRLTEEGYLVSQGDAILPTVEALRSQDPSLTQKDAAKVFARARREV